MKLKPENCTLFCKNDRRCRAIFDNMTNAVAVYTAVENGKNFVFNDFNRAAERVEKIKREKVIGRKVTEVFPGVKDFGIFAVFQRVWRTGKPEHFPVSLYKDERIVGWRENYIFRLNSGEVVAIYEDITERKQTEKHIQEQSKALEQKNIALKEVMEQISVEKNEQAKKITSNLENIILPKLRRLKARASETQKKLCESMEKDIKNVASDFGIKISDKHIALSKRELEICAMIKDGYKNKDIAEELHLSTKTIETIRKSIRRKLHINNKAVNLQTYLQTL
ncbi:MAG: PAS domain-containing protein [Planctomycetes bacterium]|nr:PAS domain-containing protein [Planctomycetota bacterium]